MASTLKLGVGSLDQFNIVRGEEAPLSLELPNPPPLVHHLNVLNDVIRVERDLIITICVCASCGNTLNEIHGPHGA